MASSNQPKPDPAEFQGLSGERWLHRISVREAGFMIFLAALVGVGSGISAVALSAGVHTAITWVSRWQGEIWLVAVPAVGAGLSAVYLKNILIFNPFTFPYNF